jgi:hypothetical protein
MSRFDPRCSNCDEPAPIGHSLPIGDKSFDIVPVNYQGEWGAVPSCKACHDLHLAAGDNAAAVLDVYAKTVRDFHERLESARKFFVKLDDATREAREEVGV